MHASVIILGFVLKTGMAIDVTEEKESVNKSPMRVILIDASEEYQYHCDEQEY